MSTYLAIYAALMAIIGIYAMLTTLLNLRHFRKLGNVKDHTEGPLISIIIPARDEEASIGRLLDSLSKQTYRNIEILVMNDQSSDRTREIVLEHGKDDPRIRCYDSDTEKKLHSNGKINALLQLIPHAKGEYILATDADTYHASDCIAHAYSIMKDHNLDIISGFPTELCPSFAGTVNISAMMLTNTLIPHFLVYHIPLPSATFAIGQFIMMRRSAYEETGGYSRIKGHMDDVGIARLFVRERKSFAFVSISEYVACYMYTNAHDAFAGIERSIAGIFPPKVISILPIAAVIILLLHIAFSPIAAIAEILALGLSRTSMLMLIGVLMFFVSWYLACRKAGWRKLISISAPLSLIQICTMYIHGLYNRLTGKGFIWKGRKID